MALVLVKSPEGCHTQGGETQLPALISLADQATEYAKASKASETRRGYASDLKRFAAFCEALGVEMLPASPPTVALYLTHLAQAHAVATIRRHMVAIAQAHKNAGLPSPVADPHIRTIVQGIRRTKGTAQRKKTALTGDLLREAVASLNPSTLQGKRDRAIVLLGFALAARRSELAALNVEDLRYDAKGLIVTIRRSKTDQSGAGQEIGVPMVARNELCAVRAVAAWIDISGIRSGALFRSFGPGGRNRPMRLTANRIGGRDVANLVKRLTGNADIPGDFAAHSLRAGFITTAASTPGVTESAIQGVSRHRNTEILRGYVRRATVFEDAPLTAMFGSPD
jgi:integrase